MPREAHTNHAVYATSSTFQCYPSVPSRIDLVEGLNLSDTTTPRYPRFLRVMGNIDAGSTEVLCVERAADGVEVAVPIPDRAVGVRLELSCRALIPHTVSVPVASGVDPGFSVTGTPTANTSVVVTITDPGDGLDPDTLEFSWAVNGGAATTGENPSSGTFTDAALNGLTLHFPLSDEWEDNSTFDFAAFVTSATNIMVEA